MSCGAERGKSKDYFQVQEENREKESEKAKNTENEFEPKPEKVESYQNFEIPQEDYSQHDFSSYNLANIFLNKKRLYNIEPFSIGCDESYSLINLRVNVPSEVMTVKVYRPLGHSFNPLMVKGECFSAR